MTTSEQFWKDHARSPHRRRFQTTRAVGRFVSGRPVDGILRTDARWKKPGTQPLTPTGHASRWAHYPHRRRASVRLMVVMAFCLGVVGLIASPASTGQTARVIAWFLLAIGGWAILEKSRRYVHRREVIAPLAEVLATRLNDSCYVLDPRTWIHVPVDVQDRPTRVYLRRDFVPTDQQEKSLAKVVASKVGLVSPSWTFDLRGEYPFMELRPAPAPRDLVLYSDLEIRALMENAPEGHPMLGLAPRDVPYGLDLEADAPHVGFSMATNAGKSVAGRTTLAQNLHRGGLGLVLDRKIVSQAWCDGLPNIRYARTCREIHDALLWVSGEIDRRYAAIKRHSDIRGNVDPAVIGPRLTLLVEELNTLEGDLRAWWREVRNPGDPLVCPSLAVLGRFVAMGRQGRMNMLVISQKLTCQSIGGTAARENLTTRVLGRATTSTWNMLAPECKVGGKYPRMSKVRGRVHVVYAGEATPVQVVFMEPEEAREYAMSGIVSVFPGNADPGDLGQTSRAADHRETLSGDLVHPAETGEPDQDDNLGVRHLRAVPDPDELVILSDAAERLAVNVDTLRNGKKRDVDFPAPVDEGPRGAGVYRFSEIEAWYQARGGASA
jgi:hypothetical protein